jgi:hypothetical protein
MESNKHIVINGLKWDCEPLSIKGKQHFMHHVALDAAAACGKRLPTLNEWKQLLAFPSVWDEEKNGRWFGPDALWKNDSKAAIFLPAAGYRSSQKTLIDKNVEGNYWVGDKFSADFAEIIIFDKNAVESGCIFRRKSYLSVLLITD